MAIAATVAEWCPARAALVGVGEAIRPFDLLHWLARAGLHLDPLSATLVV
jgi:hypothetical protein